MTLNRFNLQHLSGSTVNDFICRKHSFYNRKIKRKPFATNPSMARGKAVEHIVNMHCEGHVFASNDEIKKVALETYDKEMASHKMVNPNYYAGNDDKRDSVGNLAVFALNHFINKIFLGRQVFTQTKIELDIPIFDDNPSKTVKFVGYLDFLIHHQEVSDCKVVEKSMSKLSQDYCITGSIYKAATNLPVFYDLIVNNKTIVDKRLPLSEDDAIFGMSYLKAASRAIIQLNEMEGQEDPQKAMELLMSFPNLDEIYDKIEKKDLADQWGIILQPE